MKSGAVKVGARFHEWTVISFAGGAQTGRDLTWNCVCSCGNTGVVKSYHLTKGYSKRCRACGHWTRHYKSLLSQSHWRRILHGAKKRSIEVSVSRKEAEAIFEAQQRKCALSGEDIAFAKTDREYRTSGNTASLDRIDSRLGYTKGNIQWVHRDVNLMKNKLMQPRFIDLCHKISKAGVL